MNKIPTPLRWIWAMWYVLLCAASSNALATPNFGTRLDNWCALRPIQSVPPQQSRPYTASGSSCALCHTSGSPSSNDLNTRGAATITCTGTGAATTCGAAVNPFCVATPPTASTIAIASPPAGTIVTQGQSVTFTAGGTSTSPDGFLLSYTWQFSNGLPSADGFSVTVPMTTTGSVTATLQVRNQVGMIATGTPPTRTITVTPATNQAPTATIAAPVANVTIAQGGTVNFQGSGTDPDNNLPLTYAWSFPGGSPASSTAQNPGAVTYATAGTFTASFTVRDSLGLASTTVTRTITVSPPTNQAPTATIAAPAGNVIVNQGASVNFQGLGNDPDNNLPLTYQWSFPGGSPASSTAQNPGNVAYTTAGTFTASFTVRDSLGLASTTVTRTITVMAAANQAPTATIAAPTANVTVARGGTVNFQGQGNDPDNNLPLTYQWSFPGGSPASSTAQNPGNVAYNTAGTFTASFIVRDSLGLASATVTRSVTVTADGNLAPTASITKPTANLTIRQGGSVEFDGRGSDPDNNRPLSYEWSFPGGNPASSTRREPGKVSYATAGTFTVSFTVRDSLGLASTTATRTITVTGNQAPTASIAKPAVDLTIEQGGSVEFDGRGSDPDNNRPLTYAWSFPASSTQREPGKVSYATAGTFTATFIVRDSLGLASAPATRTITVTAPAQPVASIDSPAIDVSVAPGETVEFRGSASGSTNLPLRFKWTFDGASPSDSEQQNPGPVRFREEGAHIVTLTVTDSRGRRSETVTRTITVVDPDTDGPKIKDCIEKLQR